MPKTKQQTLNSFFDLKRMKESALVTPSKRLRSTDGSHFGSCPLCSLSFPLHKLEAHAALCDGKAPDTVAVTVTLKSVIEGADFHRVAQPIPGLFLYEDFITEDEEASIIAELDGLDKNLNGEFLPWKPAVFNGSFLGKRWGVHCNLRDRRVSSPEHPLPHFIQQILLPKLTKLQPMAGCVPNEANAIDYHVSKGHFLKSHVDDRQLSKEPIANLSLAGDCYMTFTKTSGHRNHAAGTKHKILLKRRTLQILTGKARYDFAHGIEHTDLLSSRRISVTMRESPLTANAASAKSNTDLSGIPGQMTRNKMSETAWWTKAMHKTLSNPLPPTSEPLPGLFFFHNFVTAEEEQVILTELDSHSQPWKVEYHTGIHKEKRFGVDSDLWSRAVRSPKHVLPCCFETILLPKLHRIAVMAGVIPNEANALEYRRQLGSWLKAHVDDRQKHKEPIANLSLAGDCYMTFQNQSTTQSGSRAVGDAPKQCASVKVLLQQRTLMVLSGKSRYEYTHAIDNADLLSDRRVSFTMRETI